MSPYNISAFISRELLVSELFINTHENHGTSSRIKQEQNEATKEFKNILTYSVRMLVITIHYIACIKRGCISYLNYIGI